MSGFISGSDCPFTVWAVKSFFYSSLWRVFGTFRPERSILLCLCYIVGRVLHIVSVCMFLLLVCGCTSSILKSADMQVRWNVSSRIVGVTECVCVYSICDRLEPMHSVWQVGYPPAQLLYTIVTDFSLVRPWTEKDKWFTNGWMAVVHVNNYSAFVPNYRPKHNHKHLLHLRPQYVQK